MTPTANFMLIFGTGDSGAKGSLAAVRAWPVVRAHGVLWGLAELEQRPRSVVVATERMDDDRG